MVMIDICIVFAVRVMIPPNFSHNFLQLAYTNKDPSDRVQIPYAGLDYFLLTISYKKDIMKMSDRVQIPYVGLDYFYL